MSKITEYTRVNSYEQGDVLLIDGTNGTRTLPVEKAGTAVDNTLSIAGKAADAKKTGDELSSLKSDKADKTGTYSALTAGNLATEDGANNNTPYLFRASGGGVRVGEREYDKIVGGTVAWNQLSDNARPTTTVNGVTFTNNGNGSITANGTATEITTFNSIEHSGVLSEVGHVYFLTGCPKNGSNLSFFLHDPFNVGSQYSDYGSGKIFRRDRDSSRFLTQIFINNGYTAENLTFTPQYFDLTKMFGTAIADYLYALESSTAGAGIAKLKEWGFFSEPYYPYNAGELKSVEGLSSHEMVGFNQWDEQWTNGRWADNQGVLNPAFASYLASRNKIPVLPNTSYFFHINSSTVSGREIVWYDANNNWIGDASSIYADAVFTTPNNCYYIAFNLGTNYGATYKNDICINLSDPAKNGTYEPYVKHTYPLDSDLILRGIPKLDGANQLYYDGDTYESDGTVTRRYGIVDLGTLDWAQGTTSFYNSLNGIKNVSGNVRANIICTAYTTVALNEITAQEIDKGIAVNSSTERINLRDTSFSDAASLKASLSGVYLVYELTTPTAETADPFASPQIVDQYGTEEYVTTGIVPVGHETFYPENLRQKIEGLPWNFASLIAPTEATYKATQNYTSGSLFIVNNILYKATANIANGGTITPGTNCTPTTLAAVIAAL